MKILITGDISNKNIRNFSVDKISSRFFELIQEHDLVVYNLEGPVVENEEEAKRYTLQFRESKILNFFYLFLNSYNTIIKKKPQIKVFSTKEIVNLLKINKNTLVTLANNHVKDLGKYGLTSTLKHLNEAAVKYIGAGFSKHECTNFLEHSDVVFINSNLVGVHKKGFPIHLYSATRNSYGAHYLSLHKLKNIVKQYKVEGKKVVLILHAGKELASSEEKLGIDFETIKSIHADVTVIHHPHIYVKTDYEKDNIFVIGDFIFSVKGKLDHERESAIVLINTENNQLEVLLRRFVVSEVYEKY